MSIGTIHITLEGVGADETERCRRIIHELFKRGAFAVKNGMVEINFDPEGLPSSIKKTFLWRRDKPEIPLAQSFEGAKIEIIKPIIKQF